MESMQRAKKNKCVSKTFVLRYLVSIISLYNSCFLQTNVFFTFLQNRYTRTLHCHKKKTLVFIKHMFFEVFISINLLIPTIRINTSANQHQLETKINPS